MRRLLSKLIIGLIRLIEFFVALVVIGFAIYYIFQSFSNAGFLGGVFAIVVAVIGIGILRLIGGLLVMPLAWIAAALLGDTDQ